VTAALSSIRAFLCDDVPELRTLMRFALEEEGDIRVVGEAGDAETGVRHIGELQPDVVLLDLSMPGLDGLEAIPRIHVASPGTGIVVFSGFTADRMSSPALALGADRYVEKGEPLDLVRVTVREVAETRRNGRAPAA
jgi:DNA-binding NarL/FixJ family response regulator